MANSRYKFRAWDRKLKKFMGNGDIVFSNYGDTQITANPNSIDYIHDSTHNYYEASRWEITQFTGLLDKNGKEVFEGDVVEFDKREWYRSYVLSLAEIDAKPPYYELVEFDYEYLAMRRTDFNQYCTVVGNIYENGDLLNEK